ncbi:uncharacterized protein LOC132863964 [Tachysurus vachellii]|uniref:uncharacterized protein LOC132863964 n=1 Tax=Tachysurus vachellii TaxID=175792 RepID=UPI00296AFD87|nr:uncharacterized protein LOC132863964 [Tachysurus vachellii]
MTRLDKHLQNVHKLEKPVVALYMQKAKDRLITRELALLRASKPTPPMVSHLDEVDDVAIEEGIRREMEASSQAASTEAFFAPCLTIVSSSPDASQTPSEHTNPNMHSISDSGSEAHSEHATLNMPSTSHSVMETPFAQSTLNTHPPFHSASEAHSEHATLNMPSTSHSIMETPFAQSTPNTHPLSHSASKAPNEHFISDMPSPSGSKPNQLARIQRKRALLRTPSPGCRNCHLLFAELKVVKQLLQCEVERNHELKHLHASANRANLVKYKRRKRFSPSKAPQYVRLVEEFRGHIQGVNPSRKTQENAKQRATHVLHFLEFMADSRIPNVDLLFLENHSRVRNFVAHLQEKGFKPTTQRLYLMDVVAFLKYILNMSPQSVRLGTKMINALLVELRARLRDIRPNVLRHQLSVRRSKSGKFEIQTSTSIA